MMENTLSEMVKGKEYMDGMKGESIKVLDHGFVQIVDYMGDDAAIVQAARVSYGKGTKTLNEDRGLIRYLMSHWHTTPFEMCEIKVHVKLPIFVARQWIRHRTANVNEMSARYSILPGEFYIPSVDDMGAQSTGNAQGREYSEAYFTRAEEDRAIIKRASHSAYTDYEALVDGGLSRELSRMVLPTNVYTSWYWKVNLHNLLNFLRLRCDPHAQWEIRQYADVLLGIVERWCPLTWQAFMDYRVNAVTFSATEMAALDIVMRLENAVGLSEREVKALTAKIVKDY